MREPYLFGTTKGGHRACAELCYDVAPCRMLALSRELNTQCRALPEDTTERTDSETADMNRVEGLLVYYVSGTAHQNALRHA